MEYRCRTLKPSESSWRSVEGSSPEDAAQNFHLDAPYIPVCCYRNGLPEGGVEKIYFSVVEVEGSEPVFVRTYSRGITRRGGLKLPPRREDTLEGIAEILGWKRDPPELLAPWDLEESWDDAATRRRF